MSQPLPRAIPAAAGPRRHRAARCAALAVALALPACSDGPTDPRQAEPGEVSFAYQGPSDGSFEARGDFQLSQGMLEHTYAYGQRYQGPAAIEVHGVLRNPDDSVDGLYVRIPRTSVGSMTIDSDGCPWWDDACPGVMVFLELPLANNSQARYSCELDTGTIRLTSVTGSRAVGEFSGSGDCLDRDSETGAFVPMTVTGGRFDVKVHDATRG